MRGLRLKYPVWALVAVMGASALTAACSDDDDEAGLATVDSDSSTATAPTDGSDEDGNPGDEPSQTDEAEEPPGSADQSRSTGRTPEDADLSIEQQHPDGLRVQVTGISFDDYSISVDVTAFNGGTEQAYLNGYLNFGSYSLRLVDDVGQTYEYLPPEGGNSDILLQPGEELNGTLEFRGPLRGEPEQVRLATNIDNAEVNTFDVDNYDASVRANDDDVWAPIVVVPIELTRG